MQSRSNTAPNVSYRVRQCFYFVYAYQRLFFILRSTVHLIMHASLQSRWIVYLCTPSVTHDGSALSESNLQLHYWPSDYQQPDCVRRI